MNFRLSLSVLVVLLLVAGLHLFIYAYNINLKYSTTDLKIKLSEITSSNHVLGSQLARKENLPWVEKIAKEKLGMIYPDNINYIVKGRLLSRLVSMEAAPKPN
jgi:cell division protein FtsB